MSRLVVATAFALAPARDNPNSRTKNDSEVGHIYYQTMWVSFTSYRRQEPSARLVLVSDERPPAPWLQRYTDLGVHFLAAPFVHRPPVAFSESFVASLYTLDAMAALAADAEDIDEPHLLVDPDTVARAPLAGVARLVRPDSILAYEPYIAEENARQGLSLDEVTALHADLDPSLKGPGVHYGGEFYGFTPGHVARLLLRAEEAYAQSLARRREGLKAMSTEEHMLSYALRFEAVSSANAVIRRIWTAPRYRNVSIGDTNLPIWHLPAEKGRGFSALAHGMMTSSLLDVEDAAWDARLRREFGVPRRRAGRYLYDVLGGTVRSGQSLLGESRIGRGAAFLSSPNDRA